MKTYVRIDGGICAEKIYPAVYDAEMPGWDESQPSRIGEEIPIEQRFTSELVATMIDITNADPMPDTGWVYANGVFSPPVIPGSSPEEKAAAARLERDRLLQTIYDPGVNMALRALRMSTTPESTAYAQGKVEELDEYAESLIAIPDQPGFPQSITWPAAPTK